MQCRVVIPLSSSRHTSASSSSLYCLARVCVCVSECLSVFSITVIAPAESEPEDPLELIEKHKGADVTPREGDENTHTSTAQSHKS